MAFDIDQLREATTAAKPIKDKLSEGHMDLTSEEIRTMTRAFDSWQRYLETL